MTKSEHSKRQQNFATEKRIYFQKGKLDLENQNAKKCGAGFLIFLCWLTYSVSYLGKVNYSANITQIVDFYNVTKAEAGIAPTLFFFAYGVGQVINGILCKRYNLRWVIFGSLFASSAINLIIAITPSFTIIKWLWLLNGFALSMLWPSLIRLLSENLSKRHLGKSTAAMGTTVAVGTLTIYSLSSLYTFVGNFKLAFYTAALADAVIAILWMLLYRIFLEILSKIAKAIAKQKALLYNM